MAAYIDGLYFFIMKAFSLLPAAVLLTALSLCPGITRADDDEAAELAEQPAAVQKTARNILGESKIEEVEPSYEEGQHATEVEYADHGRKMAIVIAKDGTLIQKEYRMSPADAPAAIVKAVTTQFPEGKISHIKEVDRKDAKFFEVSVRSKGKPYRLKLDAMGKPVAKG